MEYGIKEIMLSAAGVSLLFQLLGIWGLIITKNLFSRAALYGYCVWGGAVTNLFVLLSKSV